MLQEYLFDYYYQPYANLYSKHLLRIESKLRHTQSARSYSQELVKKHHSACSRKTNISVPYTNISRKLTNNENQAIVTSAFHQLCIGPRLLNFFTREPYALAGLTHE
jgi:hypothetical protein